MCGIAGLLGVPLETGRAAVSRMMTAMKHRGPDDNGVQVINGVDQDRPPVTLLHARLSILDLSPAGHQPMADKPPSSGIAPNWITFNGEIFNYRDLHNDLERGGWPCRTRSDTEVILHAYRVWGESCVHKFRGMFAWCLVDADRRQVWFCRDRLGIKPLYLFRPLSGGLIFASEVRTLLAAGSALISPKINRRALESFLAQGAVCGLESIVEGIELLGPGESLWTDWSGKPLRRSAYWQIPFVPSSNGQASSPRVRSRAVAQLGDALRDAVRLRLISDVPLGLFLSGGIDSGALAAVATETASTSLRTLTIGFDQSDYDETAVAQQVASSLKTDHQVIRLSGHDILDALPAALAAVDQPTVDGFNTFVVSQAARASGLTVALSGLGGDELFGGYPSFGDVPRALRWRKRLGGFGPMKTLLARSFRALGSRRGAKAAELLDRPLSPVHMYLLRRELFFPRERRALHDLPGGSDPTAGVPRTLIDDLHTAAARLDSGNQVSSFELSAYMRHMLLRDTDVFSMAHALEVRVPLLDHVLVELVASFAGAWKRPDPRPKPLLIDAVGPRLPAILYEQPKRGFAFPWAAWLRGPLRQRAHQATFCQDVWRSIGLEPAEPARLWERFLNNDRRVSPSQVLALVVLEDFTVRHGLQCA